VPRVIATQETDQIELPDLIEMLETGRFDARDEDCFADWGHALKKLANNRQFLGDIVVSELKARCANQVRDNQFSPQVILLHSGNDFYVRANFWPAMTDSVVVNSGSSPFFYGLAHDHNFSFLTAGYMGPGYWSEYYEFDYDKVDGYTGEQIDLRFVEKTKLDLGKVMLYRAHKDVHLQLPAEEMSISLNIVETSHAIPFRNQYKFDVKSGRIDGLVGGVALEQLLAISAHIGGEGGADVIEHYAARHPNDRVRFASLKAQASVLADPDDRIALYEAAERRDNPFIAAMARREIASLERARDWIDQRPVLQPVG
jgi:hypothetical protein